MQTPHGSPPAGPCGFSLDGRRLATASNRLLTCQELCSRKLLASCGLPDHTEVVQQPTFDPSGNNVAVVLRCLAHTAATRAPSAGSETTRPDLTNHQADGQACLVLLQVGVLGSAACPLQSLGADSLPACRWTPSRCTWSRQDPSRGCRCA